MKLITLVLCLSIAIPAFAGRRGNRRSYAQNSGNGHYTNNQNRGGYSDCYDYVNRTGGIPAARGTYKSLNPNQLTPGTVLHLQNYNWAGHHSPVGEHWVRVESVDGNGNVTFSHSNFNGNNGRVTSTLPASSFRGTVTVHQ